MRLKARVHAPPVSGKCPFLSTRFRALTFLAGGLKSAPRRTFRKKKQPARRRLLAFRRRKRRLAAPPSRGTLLSNQFKIDLSDNYNTALPDARSLELFVLFVQQKATSHLKREWLWLLFIGFVLIIFPFVIWTYGIYKVNQMTIAETTYCPHCISDLQPYHNLYPTHITFRH